MPDTSGFKRPNVKRNSAPEVDPDAIELWVDWFSL